MVINFSVRFGMLRYISADVKRMFIEKISKSKNVAIIFFRDNRTYLRLEIAVAKITFNYVKFGVKAQAWSNDYSGANVAKQ